MHVAVIPSWYPKTETDVDGIFFRLQAQALQRKGLKVGVIAPMFRYLRVHTKSIFTGPYGIRKHNQGGLNTYAYDSMYFFPRFPVVDLDRIRWVRAGMKAFARYVRENGRPDIVHAHSMNYAGILAYEIYKTYGIPYVITEHSSTITRNLIRPHQWPIMRLAAEHSAARFAVSRDFSRLLKEKYGLEWEYLPNVLGDNFARDFTFPDKGNQDYTFCTVSHLRHLKGHDLLLPAFAKALEKYPFLKLKIGGDGVEAANLRRLAQELGITHAVSFLGALTTDEVLDLMRQSDAFVLASRTETFGVVFIEALSQGLPVIATMCGGPQSIVTPENGILVLTENIPALTGALIEMYENRERFDHEKLRRDCLAEFSEEVIASSLIRTFEQIVGEKQKQP